MTSEEYTAHEQVLAKISRTAWFVVLGILIGGIAVSLWTGEIGFMFFVSGGLVCIGLVMTHVDMMREDLRHWAKQEKDREER